MLLVQPDRETGLQPFAIGLILSGMGCGALLGALVATRIAEWVGYGPVIWLAVPATCPLTGLMALARPGWSVYVAAIGLALLSTGGVVRVVAQTSLQQALTPDRLLGRMSATARFVSWAGMTVSFLPNVLSPLRVMRGLPMDQAPSAPAPPPEHVRPPTPADAPAPIPGSSRAGVNR